MWNIFHLKYSIHDVYLTTVISVLFISLQQGICFCKTMKVKASAQTRVLCCFLIFFMKMEKVLVLVVHVTHNHCQKPGPVCYNDCFSLEKFAKLTRICYLLQKITRFPTIWPSSDLRLSVSKQLRNTWRFIRNKTVNGLFRDLRTQALSRQSVLSKCQQFYCTCVNVVPVMFIKNK